MPPAAAQPRPAAAATAAASAARPRAALRSRVPRPAAVQPACPQQQQQQQLPRRQQQQQSRRVASRAAATEVRCRRLPDPLARHGSVKPSHQLLVDRRCMVPLQKRTAIHLMRRRCRRCPSPRLPLNLSRRICLRRQAPRSAPACCSATPAACQPCRRAHAPTPTGSWAAPRRCVLGATVQPAWMMCRAVPAEANATGNSVCLAWAAGPQRLADSTCNPWRRCRSGCLPSWAPTGACSLRRTATAS